MHPFGHIAKEIMQSVLVFGKAGDRRDFGVAIRVTRHIKRCFSLGGLISDIAAAFRDHRVIAPGKYRLPAAVGLARQPLPFRFAQ